MARGRRKKNKFEDLDKDFMTNIEAASDAEIRDKIAQVALNQAELIQARDLDQDLQDKKYALSEANAIYREGTKMNKLRIEYARSILEARGKNTGDSGLDEKLNVGKTDKVIADAAAKLNEHLNEMKATGTKVSLVGLDGREKRIS